jgi:plastocyanin
MHKTIALIRARVPALMLSALCLGPTVQAAEYTVEMTDDWTFSPAYLEIQVGDIVTWVNHDWTYYPHDTVCPGYWSSGLIDVDESVWLMFPFTGTFNYRDSYFYIIGMTGTIVVKPATPQQPVPATLLDPLVLSDGRFQCTVSNLVTSKTYIMQASTNLVDWVPISTNVAASSVESYVDDGAAAFPRRCYRSVHLP